MTPVIFQPTAFHQTGRIKDYPTDGLVLLLDNKSDSYPGTGDIWYDVSGNGYNFTTVDNPTWSVGEGWNLNGSSQYLSSSLAATNGLNTVWSNTKAARNGMSIYACVIHDGTGTGDDTIFAGWVDVGGIYKVLFELNQALTVEVAVNTATSGVSGGNTSGTVGTDAKIIVGFEIASNGVITAYQNNSAIAGSPATVPAENFANTSPSYRIGARAGSLGPIAHFDGKIKAVMAYSKALDATERTSVYNYLNGL